MAPVRFIATFVCFGSQLISCPVWPPRRAPAPLAGSLRADRPRPRRRAADRGGGLRQATNEQQGRGVTLERWNFQPGTRRRASLPTWLSWVRPPSPALASGNLRRSQSASTPEESRG